MNLWLLAFNFSFSLASFFMLIYPFSALIYVGLMYDMAYKYQFPCLSFCLVWWSVITWLIEWSDPFSIRCAFYLLFPCLVHFILDIPNFSVFFIWFKFRCLGPCWAVFSYMTSFVTTKACSLSQPSIVISS